MKLSTLFALATATATSVTALPKFWHDDANANADASIPELSVQDWQAIHSGDAANSKHHGNEKHSSSLWDSIKALGPFTSDPEHLIESIDSTVASLLDEFSAPSSQGDDAEKTIWQLLQQDDKYTKVVKLLKLEETGKAIKVLDDRDGGITFFAPQDDGFPEHHHDGDHDDDEDELFAKLVANPTLPNLLAASESHPHLMPCHGKHSRSAFHLGGGGDDDDDKKKKKHEIFQFILRSAIKYHGLPQVLSESDLAANNSVATALHAKFGASDNQALRIRTKKNLVPPSLEINFYSKVTSGNKQAKNGYIHTISHPLFPPPSAFVSAFAFPDKFSTLTSAVQKVGGRKYIDWDLDHEKSKEEKKPIFKGAPAITLFAPTNDAFSKLPHKLKHFLFSPFGEHVLAKVLAYHAIPKTILFTEHVHSVHSKTKGLGVDAEVEGDGPGFHFDEEFETGLKGKNVKVVVDKSKVVPVPGATKTSLKVNDIEAEEFDVPVLNGVIHVIGELLKPPHEHKKDGELKQAEWEDWEDWLLEWAESA